MQGLENETNALNKGFIEQGSFTPRPGFEEQEEISLEWITLTQCNLDSKNLRIVENYL